jgi:hypothetical protein
MAAALHLYFMVEGRAGRKPDIALLAKVMRVLGTPASESALQQRLEKQFREWVTNQDQFLEGVLSECFPDCSFPTLNFRKY